jgi:lysophospholipid acyltransferase (LPLAT)-like uncharacterized protein
MSPGKIKFISWIGAWCIRALGLTLRVRFTDNAGYLDGTLPCPGVFAFWHNRMLIMPLMHEKYYRNRKHVSVLTSASRDGGMLAAFMARFDMGSVRGSSSRRGATAVRELDDLLARGEDIAITPDGPRGPCYKLGPGLIFLAQKNKLPAVPILIEYSRCIRIKSWDRFMIPLPFSRVEVTLGAPQYIPPTATAEEFEAERLKFEKIMQPKNP